MKRKIKASADGFPSAEALHARYHSHLSLTDCRYTGTRIKKPLSSIEDRGEIAVPPYIILCSPIRNVNERLHLLISV